MNYGLNVTRRQLQTSVFVPCPALYVLSQIRSAQVRALRVLGRLWTNMTSSTNRKYTTYHKAARR